MRPIRATSPIMPRPSGLVTACTMREMRCSVPAHGRTAVKRPRAARGAGDGAVQRAWDACAARVLWVKVPWGRGGRLQVPGVACAARVLAHTAEERHEGGEVVHLSTREAEAAVSPVLSLGGGGCLALLVPSPRPSVSLSTEKTPERERRDASTSSFEIAQYHPRSPEITRDCPRLPERRGASTSSFERMAKFLRRFAPAGGWKTSSSRRPTWRKVPRSFAS